MSEKFDKEISLFAHRLRRVGLGQVLVELDREVAGGWAYGEVELEDDDQ